MRLPTLLSLLAAAGSTLASNAPPTTAAIYLQPLASPSTPPTLLAELALPSPPSPNSDTDSPLVEILSYEAPDTESDDALLRIGIYNPATQTWESSTTALSAATFTKGYAPHFALSLDSRGRVLGVACRGVAIDAGQTRDFGPQASVVWSEKGEQPVLGRPVVLSPEGKKVEPEAEKSFVQRYWWVLAIGAFLLLTGGGEQK